MTELLDKKNKINWSMLSYNHNAIQLLEKNIDKIHWTNLSENINAVSYTHLTLPTKRIV